MPVEKAVRSPVSFDVNQHCTAVFLFTTQDYKKIIMQVYFLPHMTTPSSISEQIAAENDNLVE